MAHEMLDNLVKARQLHLVNPSEEEVANLIRMGLAKLKDASHADISDYTKFDAAYNAAQYSYESFHFRINLQSYKVSVSTPES